MPGLPEKQQASGQPTGDGARQPERSDAIDQEAEHHGESKAGQQLVGMAQRGQQGGRRRARSQQCQDRQRHDKPGPDNREGKEHQGGGPFTPGTLHPLHDILREKPAPDLLADHLNPTTRSATDLAILPC